MYILGIMYIYTYVCTNQIYTKPVMNMCCHVSLITCVPKAWAMAQEKPSGVWELSYISKKAASYLYRWKVRFKKPKEGRNYSFSVSSVFLSLRYGQCHTVISNLLNSLWWRDFTSAVGMLPVRRPWLNLWSTLKSRACCAQTRNAGAIVVGALCVEQMRR